MSCEEENPRFLLVRLAHRSSQNVVMSGSINSPLKSPTPVTEGWPCCRCSKRRMLHGKPTVQHSCVWSHLRQLLPFPCERVCKAGRSYTSTGCRNWLTGCSGCCQRLGLPVTMLNVSFQLNSTTAVCFLAPWQHLLCCLLNLPVVERMV